MNLIKTEASKYFIRESHLGVALMTLFSSFLINQNYFRKVWEVLETVPRVKEGEGWSHGQGQYGGKSGGEQGSLQSLLLKGSLWGPLREFTWARAHCWVEWIGEDSYDRATGWWANAGGGHIAATVVPRMGFRSLQHPPSLCCQVTPKPCLLWKNDVLWKCSFISPLTITPPTRSPP